MHVGAKTLAVALKGHPGLKNLELGYNPLAAEGTQVGQKTWKELGNHWSTLGNVLHVWEQTWEHIFRHLEAPIGKPGGKHQGRQKEMLWVGHREH